MSFAFNVRAAPLIVLRNLVIALMASADVRRSQVLAVLHAKVKSDFLHARAAPLVICSQPAGQITSNASVVGFQVLAVLHVGG